MKNIDIETSLFIDSVIKLLRKKLSYLKEIFFKTISF